MRFRIGMKNLRKTSWKKWFKSKDLNYRTRIKFNNTCKDLVSAENLRLNKVKSTGKA